MELERENNDQMFECLNVFFCGYPLFLSPKKLLKNVELDRILSSNTRIDFPSYVLVVDVFIG